MLNLLYVVAFCYAVLGFLSIVILYGLFSPESRLHLLMFDYLSIFNESVFVTRDEFEKLKKRVIILENE